MQGMGSGDFNFLDTNDLLFKRMKISAGDYLIGKHWDKLADVDGVIYYG
jgi:hypothetical protein